MAALDKRWNGAAGTTSAYTTATNWAPISLRNGSYSWTASGSGTDEFYLRTSGGADPGISAPGAVYFNGSDTGAAGTLGALTAGKYGYGDNDALGYSTVYVRLTDGADPDSKAYDWVQMYQIPVATDHVRILVGTGSITGVDQSSVAIGDFIVEEGYTGAIGSATAPLYIDPDKFEFWGTGTSYIDIGSANIACEIRNAKGGSTGTVGLYLTGSNITQLTVHGGSVGLAVLHGQTSTVANARCIGANATLYLGQGVSLTTSYQTGGRMFQSCNATTTTLHGGVFTSMEAGTITTLNVDGTSTAVLNSTGTITTLNLKSANATADFTQCGEARTVSTLAVTNGKLRTDDTYLTITTETRANGPKQITTVPL